MLGREVVEGEQRAPVLPQAFGGLLLLDPIGERIRDKIAASKKRGFWVGGVFRRSSELRRVIISRRLAE